IQIILKNPDEDLTGKTLVTGFHSALGETGYIVLRHLAKQQGTRSIGCIMTPLIPPHVFMGDQRLLLPIELYDYNDKFVLVFTRLQPHRAEWVPFTEVLANWTLEKGLKQTILLGGLDIQFSESEARYRSAYTAAYHNTASQYELPVLEEGRGIYGPLALLLANYEIRDFPAVAILPYAERGRPDPRAASVAIEVFNRLFDLEIKTDELMADAEVIEREIKQLMERQRERETDRDAHGMFM
ncbi:MAG: PAC2 family protein, partial [Candidatus Hermodarchaeota archaeon]|nr:PAC2 family protein [Candidatus Hermodarchaeota archaeon]